MHAPPHAVRALTLPALLLALAATPSWAAAGMKRGQSPKENVTRVVDTKETALDRIQRSVLRINQEASTPEGEERVVARLSSQLRVSPDSLRAEHANWSLGYGELAMSTGSRAPRGCSRCRPIASWRCGATAPTGPRSPRSWA